jgi:CheY-like chemotaxis protein
MRVDLCPSGGEAIARIKQNEYDLVFMDHMMPGMDGIEATRRIRALPGKRFGEMPIIALTANAIAGMEEVFLDNGLGVCRTINNLSEQ